MERDLISVIVPVYNVERYLDQCIESIICQTYNTLEIILVDDGSTDSSGTICDLWAKKDSRIRVIHKENGGLSSARNTGILHAKGKYIGFVDSDDWIANDMYEMLHSLIVQGDFGFSFCRIQKTNEKIIDENRVEIINSKAFIKSLLKIGTQDSDQYAVDKLYKREILSEKQYPVGLTDEDVEGTFKALLRIKNVIGTSKIGYYYRTDNENSLTAPVFNAHKMDYLKICDNVVSLAIEYGDKDIITWAKEFRYRADFGVLARLAIMDVNNETALQTENIKKTLLSELRKHYLVLMKANIPLSRKILISAFCINYELTSSLLRKRSFKVK